MRLTAKLELVSGKHIPRNGRFRQTKMGYRLAAPHVNCCEQKEWGKPYPYRLRSRASPRTSNCASGGQKRCR
jgi:hypothetical protein